MLSILFAICVIINKNPIVSILFLICLFISIAGYLILLGLNFIGISYLLVYIGAVSILFLFILMLINIRVSEIQTETSNSVPLAIVFSISFYTSLYNILPLNFDLTFIIEKTGLWPSFSVCSQEHFKYFSFVTNYVSTVQWETSLTDVLHISSIGNVLYTNYILWLVLASIILLLAMVGTIIITIKQ